MRAEKLVEMIEHLGDAQVLGLVDVAGELPPELAQHLLPRQVAVGDPIELLLEVGGEVVFDIAPEKAFEEGGDEAALVLGDELPLLQPHIVAVAQHRERRRIGGGAADAEFLHLLDEGGFGVARRRLGEVLRRLDAVLAQPVACLHGRQAAALVVVGGVVAAFLVEGEEAVEAHDLAGGAQGDRAQSVPAAISTVVRSSSAACIWLAVMRFQISS